MTDVEQAIADTVAQMLTGMARPRVRLLMSAGPDGVISRMHVTIDFAPPKVVGDACPIVAIR